MANTTSNHELGQRIERLVLEHIAAIRRAAQDAVERAFAATTAPSAAPRQRSNSPGDSKRRAPAEIAALGDQLYRAVCAKPGERMTVLAADVGASARELHKPMSVLKRDGRVRSVGQRDRTRYFPVGSDLRASA
jgi:uncharacterized protein (DUF2126 family)